MKKLIERQLAVIYVNGVVHAVPRAVADEIAWLREKLPPALARIDELRDELARVRGENELHESGDKCLSCHQPATKKSWPWCDQCFDKTVLDYCADVVAVGARLTAGLTELRATEERAKVDEHAVAVTEMVDFLDELHAGLDHNMHRAATPLMHAFPGLTRREATVVVMCWIDEWNEEHRKEQ